MNDYSLAKVQLLYLDQFLTDDTFPYKFDDVLIGQQTVVKQVNGGYAPIDKGRGIASVRLQRSSEGGIVDIDLTIYLRGGSPFLLTWILIDAIEEDASFCKPVDGWLEGILPIGVVTSHGA